MKEKPLSEKTIKNNTQVPVIYVKEAVERLKDKSRIYKKQRIIDFHWINKIFGEFK